MVTGGRFITLSLGALLFAAGAGAADIHPVNDNFRNRIVISGITNTVQGSNVGASTEPGEPQHAGEGSTFSVWWSWTAPISGTFTISTAGSTFDTLVGVYLGSTVSNLTLVVSDDDSGSEGTSRAIFRAIAGETYQIAVAGFLGDSGSITLNLAPSGRLMPSWTLTSVDGGLVYSTNFTHKVLLIDFFRTDCPDCIEEAPDLRAYRDSRQGVGFEIIGMSKDLMPTSQIRTNAQAMGIDYPVLLNDEDVEHDFGGLPEMPMKMIVDRDGKIQKQINGGHTFSFYAALIDPLLRLDSHLQLKVQRQAGRAVLSWPASEFGYVAESSPDLSPQNWQAVTQPVIENGNSQNTVSVPVSSGAVFFRLRHP